MNYDTMTLLQLAQQCEIDARESGSVSDFPALMGNLLYRRLMQWFSQVPQDWRGYTRIIDLEDYRPQTLVMMAEAEDLLFIGQNGVYRDSAEYDRYAQIQVTKFGRIYRVNRSLVINDDLGGIKQQPERMGRAAARTLSKFVPRSILEANPATFDGVALFSTSHVAGNGTYSNLQTGPGSALSIAAITTALEAMIEATAFDGVLRPVTPEILVVPAGLKFQAMQILRSVTIIPGGTANPGVVTGNLNQVGPGMLDTPLQLIVDRYLVNQAAWYLMANPGEIPGVVVGFLKGNQEPQLLIQNPVMYNVAGGQDPYGISWDDMQFKVRYEFGGAPINWWALLKSAGA